MSTAIASGTAGSRLFTTSVVQPSTDFGYRLGYMISERELKTQRWRGECKRMIICLHAAEVHQDAKKPLLLEAVFGVGMR